MDDLYTLEDLSRRLGNIPISTLKHRIHQLGIPAAARGSRNKLLFEPALIDLLEAADRLIRDGHGIHSVRRVLKLNDAPATAATPGPDDEGAAFEPPSDDALGGLTSAVPVASAATADGAALERLSRSLESVLEQLAGKDRQLESLQNELRRALEAAATFQQKTFYLQGELQRLQGELREARRSPDPAVVQGINLGIGPLAWKRLWKRPE